VRLSLKPVEHFVRRRLLRAGRRRFTGTLATRPEDLLHLPAAPAILLMRQERIGDVLVGIPVLRALRQRYPTARIHFLVSRNNYAVRDAVGPFVDRVWRYDKTVGSALALLRALRRERYDVVVDLVDNPSATSRLVIGWCGARLAVGLAHAEASCYTHAAPLLERASVHPVERLAQLLLPFGIDPAGVALDLEYRLSEADQRRARALLGPRRRPLRFGVNISGRGPQRYWGRDNFIGLIRHLAAVDDRFQISVCGAPEDAEEVAAVAAAAGLEPVPPLESLHDFAAVIHEFDMVLTPDTSVVHLAAAWKIPAVGLFHRQPGVMPWLPYRSPHRALIDDRGIGWIPLEAAIAALDELRVEMFG
jgi:ADP-heptose:LPS heptosyltransferase